MYLEVRIDQEKFFYQLRDNQEYVLGRSKSCEIVIAVEGISRAHAKIVVRNGDFFIVDLGSTNGVVINDEKIPKGVEIPFNTFFPATLGFAVEAHLLDALSSGQSVSPLSTSLTASESLDENATVAMKISESNLDDVSKKVTKTVPALRPSAHLTQKTLKLGLGKALSAEELKGKNTKNTSSGETKTSSAKFLLAALVALVLLLVYNPQWQEDLLSLLSPQSQQPLANQSVIDAMAQEKNSSQVQESDKAKPTLQAPVLDMARLKVVEQEGKCLTQKERVYCDFLAEELRPSYLEGFFIDSQFTVLKLKLDSASTTRKLQLRGQMTKEQALQYYGQLKKSATPLPLSFEAFEANGFVFNKKIDLAQSDSLDCQMWFLYTLLEALPEGLMQLFLSEQVLPMMLIFEFHDKVNATNSGAKGFLRELRGVVRWAELAKQIDQSKGSSSALADNFSQWQINLKYEAQDYFRTGRTPQVLTQEILKHRVLSQVTCTL